MMTQNANMQKLRNKYTGLVFTEQSVLSNLNDLRAENDPEWDTEDDIRQEEAKLQTVITMRRTVWECLELMDEDMDRLHNYELFLIDVFFGKVPGLNYLKNAPVEIWQHFNEHK